MNGSTTRDKPRDDAAHDMAIVINGRSVAVSATELTFEQVVQLSGLPNGSDIVFTISYRKGDGNKPAGSMVQGGDPVKVKDRMIFNVDSTNRS